MMQWVPYGGPASDFQDQIRTFAAVFPHVTLVKGAGGYGVYMLGSSAPIAVRRARHPRGPGAARRPRRHLVGVRLAGEDGRRLGRGHRPAALARSTTAVAPTPGPGPLITDDRPRSEYFLLRRLTGGGPDE